MTSLEILVGPDGSITIKTTGFHGPSCMQEAEKLAALLKAAGIDSKTEHIELTPEHATTTTATTTGQA